VEFRRAEADVLAIRREENGVWRALYSFLRTTGRVSARVQLREAIVESRAE
jgi:hypothetical protein